MNGVEILNSYQVVETSWGFSGIGILFAVLLIVSCIFFLSYFKKHGGINNESIYCNFWKLG